MIPPFATTRTTLETSFSRALKSQKVLSGAGHWSQAYASLLAFHFSIEGPRPALPQHSTDQDI